MGPVPVSLASHLTTDIEKYSSGGPTDFVGSKFSTADVSGYPAERLAPIKRLKTDGIVLPVMSEGRSVFFAGWLARRYNPSGLNS